MSDDLYSDVYDDEPDEAPQNGPKALRDAYEREKDARRQLEERLAAIEAESKRQKLASALKGTGVNPDALGDYLDKLDPEKATDEVAAWKKAFGVAEDDGPTGISDEEAQQMAAVAGEPAGSAPATPVDDLAALKSFENEEDFWKHIRSNQ
ncbi:MAG TPA: hypothetical protein VFI97_07490 [Arthrobacter sp.]|nr:hypothetical protein [Arthrobacter sp.]